MVCCCNPRSTKSQGSGIVFRFAPSSSLACSSLERLACTPVATGNPYCPSDLSVAYGLGQDFQQYSNALHFSQRWVIFQSRSRQFGPVPISTTSGTVSLCTFSISSFTSFSSLLFSFTGSSNRSSSCTCKIIFAASFSFFNRASIEIIAILIRSAAVPCKGEFSAVRSAKFLSCTCGELISGLGRILPNKLFASPVFRVSTTTLSKYCFTPRYLVKYALMNCAASFCSIPNCCARPNAESPCLIP